MSARMLRLAPLALALAACSDGDATVVVTVDAQPALTGLAKLHASGTVGSTSSSFDVPLSNDKIPPQITFAVVVPLKYGSSLALSLDAVDASGKTVASASASTAVSAGKRSDLPITFGVTPGGDGGAGDGGSDGGSNDMAHTIPPPQLLTPQSAARVTTARPTLRWKLDPALSNPKVDVCAKRDCSTTLGGATATVATSGMQANFATDLPKGVVYWRVRADSPAGPVVSPTWQFWVTVNGTITDGSWGQILDLNGDGIAEIAASGSSNVYVYPGGPSLSTASPVVLFSPDGPSASFGYGDGAHGVAPAGDVDGDGFADLAAVSSGSSPKVFLFRGGPTGVATSPAFNTAPLTSGDNLGSLGAGDFDRDGYADLAVAVRTQTGGVNSYRILVYKGGPQGYSAPTTLTDAGAGTALAVGDIDGDGFSDLVSTNFNTDSGVFWKGSGTGLGTAHTIANPETTTGNFFGNEVTMGDFRGDGHCIVAIAAYGYMSFTGRLYLYQLDLGTSPSSHIDNGVAGEEFGASLASPGDVDGDGLMDLIVGASGAANKAYLFPGSFNSLVSQTPKATITSTLAMGNFGQVAGGRGDIDGDGFDDFALGSPNVMNSLGAVVVWYGNSGTFAARHTDLIGANANGNFGSVISDMIVRPQRRERPPGTGHGQDRRKGRAGAQPQEHRRRASAQQAHRHHGPVRFR